MRTLYAIGGLLFFGIFAVAVPLVAACAADPFLAKCDGDFPYYIRDAVLDVDGTASAGTRWVVPREDIKISWGLANAAVTYMTGSRLSLLPLLGTVPYAPGTLIKAPDDSAVYVVTRSRILRPIANEGAAAKHFGREWVSKIKEIPSSWLPQYQFGGLVFPETWFSDKEREVSASALYEATDSGWDSRERSARLRDEERLAAIQGIIIPFLHNVILSEGHVAPQVHGKWLLGTKGADWVYATDELNNNFRKALVSECDTLPGVKCIPPAPDAQMNTHLCGTQAPYGYENKDAFEVSFCIESNTAVWQSRNDDFDVAGPQLLRSGWYKYTMKGLERISP